MPPLASSLLGSAEDENASGAFFRSRVALLLVALLVSVPSPVGALWGGATKGAPWLPLGMGAVWMALSLLAHTLKRAKGGTPSTHAEDLAGYTLILDVVGLSALLFVSGAAQNPFTLLYFVPITLATVVAQKWTFRVAGLSVLGFAALVVRTSLALEGHRLHSHHAHFFQHVQGMVIALAVAGGFVTFFVQRIARSLAEQASRIEELSREKQQAHFVIALGALSAGAAHELGSPLGSVQLLAEELPHMSEVERKEAVESIVKEVQRMKAIVHSMDSSQLSAHVLGHGRRWDLTELATEIEDDPALGALTVAIRPENSGRLPTTQPKAVVVQMLRELVRNARRVASPAGVSVDLESTSEGLTLLVIDDGPGLSEEQVARATEPFVSETGGTGLGLFLATVHARELGGTLHLTSELGRGTRVTLRLPLNPPSTHKRRT